MPGTGLSAEDVTQTRQVRNSHSSGVPGGFHCTPERNGVHVLLETGQEPAKVRVKANVNKSPKARKVTM